MNRAPDELRELLFADKPLELWRPANDAAARSEPWATFEAARRALARDDRTSAVSALKRLAYAPGMESRQQLQTWHFLRSLGVAPPPQHEKLALGVVLEVHLEGGLDSLAGYADHSARYINFSGRTIVWDAPKPAMNQLIDRLLFVGRHIAQAIGPWLEPRRGTPPPGYVRINVLTPSGLHFGEGPMSLLTNDSMGGPAISAGIDLMNALIESTEKSA